MGVKAADLFCGAGGASLGLMQAGIEMQFALDADADACATYRANLGDHVHEGKIEALDPDAIPDIDLLHGSPPCQGFSYAGKRDVNDPRNRLWQEYWRIVEAKRPAFILLENVRGMLSMGEDKPLILAFRELGYRVTPYLLNAADYGVPQRRYRVFYIGNRLGIPNPCPVATHAESPRHVLLGLEPWVTVRQALGIGQSEPSQTLRAGAHGAPGWSPRHQAGYVVDEILDAPSSTIRFQNGGHDADPKRMASLGLVRPQGWVPVLPNIPLDAPSPTIQGGGSETGGAEPVTPRLRNRYAEHGDGATFDEPAPTVSADRGLEEHWLEDAYDVAPTVQADSRVSKPGHPGPGEPRMMLRRLTPWECQILQDFPPDFTFQGTKTSQHRQIGNAVPPGMARAIGAAILETITAWRATA